MPPLQSAYRAGHSTETALIKVTSDIIDAADDQQVTTGLAWSTWVPILTPSTTTSSCLDWRHRTVYGGKHFKWLTSFLAGRTQAVSYAGRTSPQCRLSCVRVPQVPGLGHLLFVLLHGRCDRNRPGTRSCESTYMPTTPRSISCVRIINQLPHVCWPGYLKSNPGWAQISWNRMPRKQNSSDIGTRQQLSKVEEAALMVCGQSVTPMVKSYKDLGVFIYGELTMEVHVIAILYVAAWTRLRQLSVNWCADPRQPACTCQNIC